MTESDILHECGDFWVAACRLAYTVYRNGTTHAVAVASFPKSDDGLSVAMAYCSHRGNGPHKIAKSG